MNDRFPILSFVSMCLKIFGWLFVVFGLLYAVAAGMIEPIKPGHRFDITDAIDIAAGLGIVISGLITAAFGEIIGVLFAIEDNTRQAYDAIRGNKSLKNTTSEKIRSDASSQIQRTSTQEMYDNGICPECGANIDKTQERCSECGISLTKYMQ